MEDAEGWRDDLRGELEECLVCILDWADDGCRVRSGIGSVVAARDY